VKAGPDAGGRMSVVAVCVEGRLGMVGQVIGHREFQIAENEFVRGEQILRVRENVTEVPDPVIHVVRHDVSSSSSSSSV
jgi:hypothetical protein